MNTHIERMLGIGQIVSLWLANIAIMSVVAREYATRDEPYLPEEVPDSGEEANPEENTADLMTSQEYCKAKLSQESKDYV